MLKIGKVVEYDIKQANISCLKACGYITNKYYKSLLDLPKDKRNIVIGLAMRDGIIDSKKRTKAIKFFIDTFIDYNDIPESQVLTIANDAVWTLDIKPTRTEFADGVVKFVKKQEFDIILTNDKVKAIYYNMREDTLMVRGFDRSVDIDIDPFFRVIKNILFYILNDYNINKIGDALLSINNIQSQIDVKTIKQFMSVLINHMFVYQTKNWTNLTT